MDILEEFHCWTKSRGWKIFAWKRGRRSLGVTSIFHWNIFRIAQEPSQRRREDGYSIVFRRLERNDVSWQCLSSFYSSNLIRDKSRSRFSTTCGNWRFPSSDKVVGTTTSDGADAPSSLLILSDGPFHARSITFCARRRGILTKLKYNEVRAKLGGI